MIMRTLLIILAFVLFPAPLYAATLRVEGPSAPVGIGRDITLRVWLLAEDEAVNAAEGAIRIPDGIHVEGADAHGSAFPVWTTSPRVILSDGVIAFSGGVPNGIPPGREALLFTIHARATAPGEYAFVPEGIRVYRNDGRGTLEPSPALRASVSVEIEAGDEALSLAPLASTPVTADIGRDDALFDGRYFLAFYGGTLPSGVDHYEVKEGWFGKTVRADGYHVLADQGLTSRVTVTAVGTDGSRESVTVPAANPPYWIAALIGLLTLALIITFALIRLRRTYTP